MSALGKKMKPKTDLIVNSVCLLLFSPVLGMMAAGLAIGLLEGIILTIGFLCGLIASLFFNIDFTSFAPRMELIKTISLWAIAVVGSVGGLIWAYTEIKDHWERFKVHGRGW
jgi:uncharacterized membrane protein